MPGVLKKYWPGTRSHENGKLCLWTSWLRNSEEVKNVSKLGHSDTKSTGPVLDIPAWWLFHS